MYRDTITEWPVECAIPSYRAGFAECNARFDLIDLRSKMGSEATAAWIISLPVATSWTEFRRLIQDKLTEIENEVALMALESKEA